ncbi:putative nuclease [uncultured Mediterranean phage uvMED]|nr:putative nuclease [uncultured Mediterranean phage uvMED]BAR17753.1 SMC domain protein [uncultured Mediterranean phage uvMED]
MWRVLRTISSLMMIDKLTKRVKEITNVEPSLDEALERYSKAQRTVVEMEQVIAQKHKRLQEVVNRVR